MAAIDQDEISQYFLTNKRQLTASIFSKIIEPRPKLFIFAPRQVTVYIQYGEWFGQAVLDITRSQGMQKSSHLFKITKLQQKLFISSPGSAYIQKHE